jgi:hypothetical protein
MTDEERIAAEIFFPDLPPEEACEKFLYHRCGAYTDQFVEETKETAAHTPVWDSAPPPTYGDYPGEWYGQLWWKDREKGAPDPAQEWWDSRPKKEPWYKRCLKLFFSS